MRHVVLVALATAVVAAAGHAADPQAPGRMKVPGTWRGQAAALDGYDGFAWYRAHVTVPPEWTKGQLVLYVEKVDNASETFFNGVKIGVAGTMPPAYESGLADAEHRYVIPPEIVRRDAPNLVAIRVYDHDGDAGFKGIAPCLLGGGRPCRSRGNGISASVTIPPSPARPSPTCPPSPRSARPRSSAGLPR